MELNEGYKIPMNLGSFFTGRNLERCSIQESIASYLHLLIITTHDEFAFDPEFGCDIWDYEFEQHQTTRIWAERLAHNLSKVIGRYEKRLTDIKSSASLSQMEFEGDSGNGISVRLKKKLHIKIDAKLTATNEDFFFRDDVLLSPFSTD